MMLLRMPLLLLMAAPLVAGFQLTNFATRGTTRRHRTFTITTKTSSPARTRRRPPVTPPHFVASGDDSVATNKADDSSASGTFDVKAVVKYILSIVVQMSLIFALFTGLDKLVAARSIKVPFAVNCFFFYFLALKSRVFNPLANTRPNQGTLETKKNEDDDSEEANNSNKRKMPSWTPPGFVFPIVWLLIIGPIRAVTSTMVYETVGGTYACLPIVSLMLHLSIGDLWNTINNVERRYGVSVTAILFVWLSKAHAAYQYGLVKPLAGKLLGGTLIWLTVASALITATWRLNPDPDTGKPEPLYPVTGKVETKFAWFSNDKNT